MLNKNDASDLKSHIDRLVEVKLQFQNLGFAVDQAQRNLDGFINTHLVEFERSSKPATDKVYAPKES